MIVSLLVIAGLFLLAAKLSRYRWLLTVAIIVALTLPTGFIFVQLFSYGEPWGSSLSILAAIGLYVGFKDKAEPYLKQWGIIDQWDRLKAKLSERHLENRASREEPQTDEEEKKDRQLRIAVGERFGELEPSQIVRGVWETITTRTSIWHTGTALSDDSIEAVHIAVVRGTLLARTEKKTTYHGALENPLQPDARVSRMIDLAEINSIELVNSSQYFGESSTPFGTNDRPSQAFKKRHPYVGQSKGKTVFIDYSACWIVFAFLASGDRVPLLRSWDYDACVKWRTQIANLVQAERMKMAQTPVESDEDYL